MFSSMWSYFPSSLQLLRISCSSELIFFSVVTSLFRMARLLSNSFRIVVTSLLTQLYCFRQDLFSGSIPISDTSDSRLFKLSSVTLFSLFCLKFYRDNGLFWNLFLVGQPEGRSSFIMLLSLTELSRFRDDVRSYKTENVFRLLSSFFTLSLLTFKVLTLQSVRS